MTILLSDPLVATISICDNDEPLVQLDPALGGNVTVRAGLAARLEAAQADLPDGLFLHVVEGYRSPEAQQAIVDAYSAELRKTRPAATSTELHHLTSRFVAPLEVAPHVAGAAVDLTLVDAGGRRLWMGSQLDATPEESDGACYFDAPVDAEARAHRTILARALQIAGLVNYPTEWWHWSYGDRYWALVTGSPQAVYGPVSVDVAA